jgi:ribosome maturation factor RimP
MDFEIVKSSIDNWLQPMLEEKDLFLVEVRFAMGRKIEVYVDSDTGINIDDCATISRFLEQHLDGSGIVPDNYILEVSSPGMSNPLVIPRQYKKRIGRMLEVIKNDGTVVEAQLEAADDEQIKLKEVLPVKSKTQLKAESKKANPVVAKEYEIKYNDIKRAVLQFKF